MCVCVAWNSQIKKKIVYRLRADRADDDNNKRKYIYNSLWLIAVLTFDCNVNADYSFGRQRNYSFGS